MKHLGCCLTKGTASLLVGQYFQRERRLMLTKRDSNIFTLEDDLDSISEYECVLNECEVK